MKRYIIIITAVLSLLFSGCRKDKEAGKLSITGRWELSDIMTKAAQIGGQTVEVFLTFNADGTFSMEQMLGQGRFHEYDGTWNLSGTTLSGKYSDGNAWGAVYTVSVEDDSLYMTAQNDNGETYVYTKVK